MSFFSWLGIRRANSKRGAAGSKPRPSCRLKVEQLEDRAVPASYSAATVPELIDAINAANLTAEADTIALVSGAKYSLTAVHNTVNGPTGLPVITGGESVTILGNGSIIERSTASGTPAFRLFAVADGAALSLENMTLQGGVATSSSIDLYVGAGGALYNQGTLTLRGVTIQNNSASGAHSFGGGVFSSGALTVENSSVRNNQSIGARGMDASSGRAGPVDATNGGSALGGGLFVQGGTALLMGVTLSGNTAQGGDGGDGSRGPNGAAGGNGGNGLGGGLYAAGGVITLRETVVTSNTAKGGAKGQAGQSAGLGVGGGLYIEADALAYLDAFTVDHLKRNKASTSHSNIYGVYDVIS